MENELEIPRSNSEVLGRENVLGRDEERKQDDPNASIRNEPEIAGAFNSVEQNLIAVENDHVSAANADITMQAGRNDAQFIQEMRGSSLANESVANVNEFQKKEKEEPKNNEFPCLDPKTIMYYFNESSFINAFPEVDFLWNKLAWTDNKG